MGPDLVAEQRLALEAGELAFSRRADVAPHPADELLFGGVHALKVFLHLVETRRLEGAALEVARVQWLGREGLALAVDAVLRAHVARQVLALRAEAPAAHGALAEHALVDAAVALQRVLVEEGLPAPGFGAGKVALYRPGPPRRAGGRSRRAADSCSASLAGLAGLPGLAGPRLRLRHRPGGLGDGPGRAPCPGRGPEPRPHRVRLVDFSDHSHGGRGGRAAQVLVDDFLDVIEGLILLSTDLVVTKRGQR